MKTNNVMSPQADLNTPNNINKKVPADHGIQTCNELEFACEEKPLDKTFLHNGEYGGK